MLPLSLLISYASFPLLNSDVFSSLWTPESIFKFVILMTWAAFIWETYLMYRQYTLAKGTPSVPTELSGCLDQVTYAKARSYHLDKTQFHFVTSTWEQILQTAILCLNGIPLLWQTSGEFIGHFGYDRQHEITQTVVFSLLGSIISTIIDLPFSVYLTFIIEERHGFNKQSLGFYAKDKVKKFIVMQAILLPVIACIVHIVKIGGDYFFVYLWVFCVVMSLIFVTVYADYIAPLFDKFEPLEEGELRNSIEELAASIHFPLRKLYVVEGSKRSAHSNAYFYGFFKNKRIVLFDTLLKDYVRATKEEEKKETGEKEGAEVSEGEKSEGDEKSEGVIGDCDDKEKEKAGCSNEEVIAVLAHELGHWQLNHVIKNVIIAQVSLFLCFAVFALLYKNKTLYAAFGFKYQRPIIIGLVIIFQYIFSPYNELVGFLMTSLSRRFEFQADAFAKSLNRAADLRSALIKLNKDNLGFPVYDWLFSAWHHSHPPLLQRVRLLGKVD